LQILTTDVIKSSEIEGEKLDTEQVRSSLARRAAAQVMRWPTLLDPPICNTGRAVL